MTFRDALLASPAIFPLACDPSGDILQFVELTESEFAAISFLDRRMLAPSHRQVAARWGDVRPLAEALPRRCHFIFHISHCGSTLLSRLLGSFPEIFSLREPGILRHLATRSDLRDRCGGFLGLWSRTFRAAQTSLIKATSFVNEIAPLLLQLVPDARALLMHVPATTFLPALLDGAYSDIADQAEARLNRLRQLAGIDFDPPNSSRGQWVALSWLCEMLSLDLVHEQFPDRTLGLDFDRFVRDPAAGLEIAIRHLHASANAEPVRQILAGPLLRQYAKRSEQAYNARDRGELLDRAGHQHADEVRRGLDWLERVVQRNRGLASRLQRMANS